MARATAWDYIEPRFLTFGDSPADPLRNYVVAEINAGRKRVERIVPPAGEAYAFDRDCWPVNVQVIVSPQGRSVQVWLNGERIRP